MKLKARLLAVVTAVSAVIATNVVVVVAPAVAAEGDITLTAELMCVDKNVYIERTVFNHRTDKAATVGSGNVGIFVGTKVAANGSLTVKAKVGKPQVVPLSTLKFWYDSSTEILTVVTSPAIEVTQEYFDNCVGAQPEDEVVYGDWIQGVPDCNARTGVETRSVTTYKWSWSAAAGRWQRDAGTAVQESQAYVPSDQQCAPDPVKPEPKVTEGEWGPVELICSEGKAQQSREITTTPYIWDGEDWQLDAANATVSIDVQDVALQDGDCTKPVKPKDIVTYGEPVRGPPECQDNLVKVTTPFTTVSFSWDEAQSKWIANPPVEGKTVDVEQATLEECPVIPVQPAAHESVNSWTMTVTDCEAMVGTQTRQLTTTPYKWDGTTWVWDTANARVDTQTRTIVLTEEDCAVEVEPFSLVSQEMVCVNKSPTLRTTVSNNLAMPGKARYTGGGFTKDQVIAGNSSAFGDVTLTKAGLALKPNLSFYHGTNTTGAFKLVIPDFTVTQEFLDDCYGPQPEPEVVYGEWAKTFDCEARTGQQSRTVATHNWVWKAAPQYTWVRDGAGVTNTQTEPYVPTLEECPRPEKPAALVEVTWSTETPTCDVRTVTRTQTTVTTEFVDAPDGIEWVAGVPVSEVTDTMEVVKDAADCAPVTPPKPSIVEQIERLVRSILKSIFSWWR